jgi:erythromycin esterase
MFRYLVENMGFRAFAIESGWTGANLAERYVQTCEGSPEEALRRHIIVWRSTELGDLAQWMCEWNRDHSNPADKVHYFGFDIQQPEDDGPALLAFLQRIGIPADHPWVAGIQACEGVTATHPHGEIPRAIHDRCIQALNGIETYIQRNRSALLRQMSPEDFEIAKLQVIGLRAWQVQVFLIAHDFAAGYSARDEGMAYAFLKLRALRFPKARTVVWAANSHVSRTVLPNGARPLGSHLAAALGRNYVNFGFTAHEAESPLLAVNCGTYVPDSRSVEERLYALGEETLLVDLAFPGTRSPYLRRGLYPVGSETLEPHRNFTGMIYLERSDGMHSYEWAPCR